MVPGEARQKRYRQQALTEIPKNINLEGGILDLRDNAIESLEEDRDFLGTRSLLLRQNVLRTINFGTFLQNLGFLDLSDNKIHCLDIAPLTSLQFLDLAGNDIRNAEAIRGLSNCSQLRALDVSRNSLSSFLPAVLHDLPQLQLLSLLGNPQQFSSRDYNTFKTLAVWNGRVLSGKEREANGLRERLPSESGFTIIESPAIPSELGEESCQRRTTSFPSADTNSYEETSEQEPIDNTPGLARRGTAPVLDSADDMTSGRTSNSSGSEAGQRSSDPNLPGHLVLVERQDSANYQPRPPALAERQDSAQVLQALAEDEAALTASGALTEVSGLTRQDSARDLGETLRSPSPHGRRAASPRFFGALTSDQRSISTESALSPGATERPSQRALRPDLGDSPRQASPSSRLAAGGSGVVERGAGGSDMDRSPRQDVENARPSSAFDPSLGSSTMQSDSADVISNTEQSRNPFSQSREAMQQSPPAGVLSPRGRPLEAARQLLHSLGSVREEPSREQPANELDMQAYCRQDSALDTLSEARRAVLSDLPHPDYPTVSTSDPLQQARKLYQDSTVPLPPGLPRVQAHLSPRASIETPDQSLLRGRGGSQAGPLSPFEGPLTPLSPAWTASQLQPGFLQQLPSIESGIPWTFSSGSGNQPSSRPVSGEEGSLLAEARRVVLGGEAKAPSSSSFPAASPSHQEGSSRAWEQPPPAVRTHSGSTTHLASRDTPYPDSPLGASTTAEHVASQQAARAFVDAAGPSR